MNRSDKVAHPDKAANTPNQAQEQSASSSPASARVGASKKASLLKSSMVMASGTMVSRLLGFIRAAMLLAAVGAVGGGVSATFQVANSLPNMVYNMLAAGVFDAVLVPQIVRALKRRNGDVFVNRFLTLAGTILFLVTVIAMVCTPLLVMLLASGFDGPARTLTMLFCLLCLPQIFFYGLYNLLGQLLNARGVFGPYMWAPVVNNVIAIAGLGLFLAIWGTHGTIFPIDDFTSWQFWALGGFATTGVICQALILLWPLKRSGIKLRLDFHFKGTSFGSASRVAGWTFATLGVSQIGIISSTNLATQADGFAQATGQAVVGYVAYTTTFMVYMVPQSLITVSLATAIFTRLATAAADHNHRAVAENYHMGVRLITMLCLLSAAILMAGAVPVIQLVIPAASQDAVQAYAWVLAAFMPAAASGGITLMSQRVFFAYEDARPVFLLGIVPTLIQIIIGWSLFFTVDAKWWAAGAALAETISRLAQGFLGIFFVAAKNRFVNPGRLIAGYVTYFISGAVALAVTWLLLSVVGPFTDLESGAARFGVSFLKLLGVTVVASVIYIGALRVVAPRESARVFGYVAGRLHLPAKLFGVAVPTATGPERATATNEGGVSHNKEARTVERGVSMDDSKRDEDQVQSSSEMLSANTGSDQHQLADANAQDVPASGVDHSDQTSVDDHVSQDDQAEIKRPPTAAERADSEQASHMGWNMISRSWSASDPTHTGELPIITDAVLAKAAGAAVPTLAAAVLPPVAGVPAPNDLAPVTRPAKSAGSGPGEPSTREPELDQSSSTQDEEAAPKTGAPESAERGEIVPEVSSSGTDEDTSSPLVTENEPDDPTLKQTRFAEQAQQTAQTSQMSPSQQALDASQNQQPLPSTTAWLPPASLPEGNASLPPNVGNLGSLSHFPWPKPDTQPSQPSRSGHIDPTKPALIFAAILVVVGAIWSVHTAFEPVAGIDQLTGNVSIQQAGQSGQSGQSGALQSGSTPAQIGSTPIEVLTPRVFSWNNDDGDHPDLAVNMVDGNGETQWYSRWYDVNQFREDDTITILFPLKQAAPLSEITLTLPAGVEGGEVVVRNVTDTNQPRQGTILATSSLTQTTSIKLDQPTTVNAFSLSFNTLPTDTEGKFRVFLSEVSVK